MWERIREMVRTIRFKLLISLLFLLGASIAVSLVGIWRYERDRYTDIAQKGAMRAAQATEKAIRSAMRENDWEMIRHTVEGIYDIIEPSNISIIANDGTVKVAGDKKFEGRRFDRHREAECTVCHDRAGSPPLQAAIFLDTAEAGVVLRNVVKVANEPACHACHAPELKNLGIFVYDAPFAEIFAMLRTVLIRTVLTGVVTFLIVAAVLSLIVRRYVSRPLQQLEQGFFKVGKGDFGHWVEVEAGGEIQDMAVQFNVMNQAIRRSFAEIKSKNWETEQLYAFVRRLSRETEWHRLRRMVVDLLQETFSAKHAALLLNREKQGTQVTEVSWRDAGDRRNKHREYSLPPPAGDLPAWLAEDWEYWRRSPKTRVFFSADNTTVLVSLATHNVPLGLFSLHRHKGRPFSGMERKLLATLCEQIEVSLVNARLYSLAITDALTGLYSKRYCETMIRKFLDAYETDPGQLFSVLMLDLDHFKQVNDTYGHKAGDEVLAQLGVLIQAHVRRDDVACRYGGEEFIILVAGGAQGAGSMADRLLRSVGEHLFRCADGVELRNTISIGVAGFPENGKTADQVIAAADQALYEAKRQGRNRCVVAGAGPAVQP